MKQIIIAAIFAITPLAIAAKEPLTIDRNKLPDGSSSVATVEGTVADPRAQVWVIVHPKATNVCWVQPEASINKNRWEASIHLGEQNDRDTFEIRAIGNPATALRSGAQVSCWPKAQWMSEIVQVTRK